MESDTQLSETYWWLYWYKIIYWDGNKPICTAPKKFTLQICFPCLASSYTIKQLGLLGIWGGGAKQLFYFFVVV